MKEQEARVAANAPLMPTRSIPEWGVFTAAGRLIVMLAAVAHPLVPSQARPS